MTCSCEKKTENAGCHCEKTSNEQPDKPDQSNSVKNKVVYTRWKTLQDSFLYEFNKLLESITISGLINYLQEKNMIFETRKQGFTNNKKTTLQYRFTGSLNEQDLNSLPIKIDLSKSLGIAITGIKISYLKNGIIIDLDQNVNDVIKKIICKKINSKLKQKFIVYRSSDDKLQEIFKTTFEELVGDTIGSIVDNVTKALNTEGTYGFLKYVNTLSIEEVGVGGTDGKCPGQTCYRHTSCGAVTPQRNFCCVGSECVYTAC